ncbi:MAG: CRISPR-associated protein [Planctomycetes bacterium]|nr:CRISPR-associated protein [Planctomycetota bacterium]
MEPLAHSARPRHGILAQTYAEHVKGVVSRALLNAQRASAFYTGDARRFVASVGLGAEYHDLGKMDPANQDTLRRSSTEKLPVNHVDAGVAQLFSEAMRDSLAATIAYAHHIGLPDFLDQSQMRPGFVLRDPDTKSLTDARLMDYLDLHQRALADTAKPPAERPGPPGLSPSALRVALSCLVDADHQDTAVHYGNAADPHVMPLDPVRRLELLDRYVESLPGDGGERHAIRKAVYKTCRTRTITDTILACDSPVGSGKTTAVMAHLLKMAGERGLRRVFVVLPYTNIINQSVKTYRRALVKSAEDPETVVAAHHHRAEFAAPDSRHLALLWYAPIVVTTAVQFFETLAGNYPSAIRKLHNLPGSAVFIDEAHAALPAHLWPQAWRWLREFEREWRCHVVLGSGSLSRFWELEEFSSPPARLAELVPADVRDRSYSHEQQRLVYASCADRLDVGALLARVQKCQGPRLVILNTVYSAATVAREIAVRNGRTTVEHLSTALCPRDRETTLAAVEGRLKNKGDTDWALVGTSCIESGLDLSFRTGWRERASLNSLLQSAGRVNREGEARTAKVWDFELRYDAYLRPHPEFEASARILADFLAAGPVGPDLCTEAMRREVRAGGLARLASEIKKAEENRSFPEVARKFRVITEDTVTAVVDEGLAQRLAQHERVTATELQRLSVQIRRYREGEYALNPIPGHEDVYAWTLKYDAFLGYMAGVLDVLDFRNRGAVI